MLDSVSGLLDRTRSEAMVPLTGWSPSATCTRYNSPSTANASSGRSCTADAAAADVAAALHTSVTMGHSILPVTSTSCLPGGLWAVGSGP